MWPSPREDDVNLLLWDSNKSLRAACSIPFKSLDGRDRKLDRKLPSGFANKISTQFKSGYRSFVPGSISKIMVPLCKITGL